MDFSSINYKPENYERTVLEHRVQEIFNTRAKHLEAYAAAFVREVGEKEASKYALVESTRQLEDGTIQMRWEFQRLEDL